MTTPLDYARAYLARGWSIVPLVPGTKRPAVELHPYLSGERRMTDHDAETAWSERRTGPAFGIGIICGRPSGGLVVLDVDPRNGGNIQEVDRFVELGPRVLTGGGGAHFYCQATDYPPPAKGKTSRAGVDRQGEGSFVVAPPTLHPSGLAYKWDSDDRPETYDAPLPRLPTWALEPAPRPAPLPGGLSDDRWVADRLASPHLVEPGTQEETLTRLCWWAAGHLERDIAQSVIGPWMEGLTLGNPSDPWTLRHLTDRLDRAYQNRQAAFVVTSPNAPPTGYTLISGAENQAIPYVPASAFVPLADLQFPEQRWIVEDFIAPGAFTEVIGKVKKGKSTLGYQLIRSVLLGEAFLGRKVEQGPVVVLTEQEGSSLRATLERAQLYQKPYPMVVIRKSGLAQLGIWSKAAADIVDHALWIGAKMIVVDTLGRLAKLHGDAENSSGAVAILDPLERAREAGIACMFVRHARKGTPGSDDDIADSARGSSAITGDMDIVIRLKPAEGTLRTLSWESRLTDDPEDLTLQYVDGQYEITDAPEGARSVKHRERVEEMRRMMAEGLPYSAMAARAGWSSPSTIAKYKRLVAEGEPLARPPTDGTVTL